MATGYKKAMEAAKNLHAIGDFSGAEHKQVKKSIKSTAKSRALKSKLYSLRDKAFKEGKHKTYNKLTSNIGRHTLKNDKD